MITEAGDYYEGILDSSFEINGFVRSICAAFSEHSIGYQKDGTFEGNASKLDFEGKVKKEGWFESGMHKGDFHTDDKEYLENLSDYFDKDA